LIGCEASSAAKAALNLLADVFPASQRARRSASGLLPPPRPLALLRPLRGADPAPAVALALLPHARRRSAHARQAAAQPCIQPQPNPTHAPSPLPSEPAPPSRPRPRPTQAAPRAPAAAMPAASRGAEQRRPRAWGGPLRPAGPAATGPPVQLPGPRWAPKGGAPRRPHRRDRRLPGGRGRAGGLSSRGAAGGPNHGRGAGRQLPPRRAGLPPPLLPPLTPPCAPGRLQRTGRDLCTHMARPPHP
jgi:hypothetical protein